MTIQNRAFGTKKFRRQNLSTEISRLREEQAFLLQEVSILQKERDFLLKETEDLKTRCEDTPPTKKWEPLSVKEQLYNGFLVGTYMVGGYGVCGLLCYVSVFLLNLFSSPLASIIVNSP